MPAKARFAVLARLLLLRTLFACGKHSVLESITFYGRRLGVYPMMTHNQQEFICNVFDGDTPHESRQPMHWPRSELAVCSFCDCSTA